MPGHSNEECFKQQGASRDQGKGPQEQRAGIPLMCKDGSRCYCPWCCAHKKAAEMESLQDCTHCWKDSTIRTAEPRFNRWTGEGCNKCSYRNRIDNRTTAPAPAASIIGVETGQGGAISDQ